MPTGMSRDQQKGRTKIMSTAKLYKTRIIVDMVVLAESQAEARLLASKHANAEISTGCPVAPPTLVREPSDLPEGWNLSHSPWMNKSTEPRTIREILKGSSRD